jgi:hypothetical protein
LYDTKSWLLLFPLPFSNTGALFILEDWWIFNFSRAGGVVILYIALALSLSGGTKAAGRKNVQSYYACRSIADGKFIQYCRIGQKEE